MAGHAESMVSHPSWMRLSPPKQRRTAQVDSWKQLSAVAPAVSHPRGSRIPRGCDSMDSVHLVVPDRLPLVPLWLP